MIENLIASAVCFGLAGLILTYIRWETRVTRLREIARVRIARHVILAPVVRVEIGAGAVLDQGHENGRTGRNGPLSPHHQLTP